eukprot:1149562-Pelagomonas_calceolata.AAC.4
MDKTFSGTALPSTKRGPFAELMLQAKLKYGMSYTLHQAALPSCSQAELIQSQACPEAHNMSKRTASVETASHSCAPAASELVTKTAMPSAPTHVVWRKRPPQRAVILPPWMYIPYTLSFTEDRPLEATHRGATPTRLGGVDRLSKPGMGMDGSRRLQASRGCQRVQLGVARMLDASTSSEQGRCSN